MSTTLSRFTYTPGHSRVVSAGVYLPENRVTSTEVMEQVDSVERFGLAHDWLERLTGISERRVAPHDMLPSDMAARAAMEALERGAINPREIDALIFAGVIRDHMLEPSTAHIVQAKIGADNATVFDVNNACLGFMTGMHLMDALIATGQVRRGLVVCGEQGYQFTRKAYAAINQTMARDAFNKLVAGLTLGDAGAAMVLGPKLDPDTGFMGYASHSRGQHAALCTCGNPTEESPLYTDMTAIIGESEKLVTDVFYELMGRLNWRARELSKYIVHQVGTKIFKLYAKNMHVPVGIMPNTVSTLGNIITATIPVNLYRLIVNNDVEDGQKVVLSGAGSGICTDQAGLIWRAA
ncbi:MAG: 3-oxoacyl-ACP synthase III family protein [Acidiferrobacterales bacterium]